MKSCLRLLVALLLFSSFSSLSAGTKPILLIKDGNFAQYDIPRFIDRVLAPNGIVWVEVTTFVPEDFSQYSAVILFSGITKALSPEEIESTKKYLESGGLIVHTGGGLFLSGFKRNPKLHPWLKALSWNYHSKTRIAGKFLVPNHPFLKGVDTSREYSWMNGFYSITPGEGTTAIIGDGTYALLSDTPIEKGHLVFLWEGPFRTRETTPAEREAYEKILLNIIQSTDPLTKKEEVSAKFRSAGLSEDSLLLWKRDWQYQPQERALFIPSFPEKEEIISTLSFASAMDERDTQFFLCQTGKTTNLTVSASPLKRISNNQEYPSALSLFVSEKPPVIPSLIPKDGEALPQKLGEYNLTPITGKISLVTPEPRIIWVSLSTMGLEAGEYRSTLTLSTDKQKSSLPISVKIFPVRMPVQRPVELRYWGGGMPAREPFVSELERQGSPQLTLSYPDLKKILVGEEKIPLSDALKKKPALFDPDNFPILDFEPAYGEAIKEGLSHNLTYIWFRDVRTGSFVAAAGTGEKTDPDVSQWSEKFQKLYTLYYKALYAYFTGKGFLKVDLIWIDEPSSEEIQASYIPRAKLFAEAGMGSGTAWTAGGFMTPEEINTFAPYTSDFSMYTIMLPKFLQFMKEGVLKLHERAYIGTTRGGTGLLLRNPYNSSRTLGWTIAYYGQPVSFLRTGPLWKGWLYYVDFDEKGARPEGVEGERLVAYGPEMKSILSSSDWEGARDGVDDASLVRMLEWYMEKLAPLAGKRADLATTLAKIARNKENWFGKNGKGIFQIKPSQYHVKELSYDYDTLIPPSSSAIEELKRKVLEDLALLAPYAKLLSASLKWHEVLLVENGKSNLSILIPQNADPAIVAEASSLAKKIASLSGFLPKILQTSSLPSGKGPFIVAGSSEDLLVKNTPVEGAHPIKLPALQQGDYRITKDSKGTILLINGADTAGVTIGIKNFGRFLKAEGGWIEPSSPQ